MFKREKVENNQGRRKSARYAKKSTSFGIIAACIGVMAAVIGRGMQLDKEEAEAEKLKDINTEETSENENAGRENS